jgi:nucleotide-binding universal stress UspA family protein
MATAALERQAAMAVMPAYQRILVPLDGSPEAETVLPHARSMARRFGATLELVRAYAPTTTLIAAAAASAMPGGGPLVDTAAYMTAGREEAETYLEQVDRRLRRQGLKVEHRQLDGSPGESIVAEAERSGADMIAMSTHARAGLDRLVHGSVASYVSHHASCPVLLVRPDTAGGD